MKFEWDRSKEAENVVKHGVDFSTVPEAFGDSRRIFIRYPGMTEHEIRWQLVGFDGQGILTQVSQESQKNSANLTILRSEVL